MKRPFEEALSDGISQAMASYGRERGLPALSWYVSTHIGPETGERVIDLAAHAGRGEYADADRVPAVEKWVEHVGFTGEHKVEVPPSEHTVEWRGVFEGVPLTLWAITDEDAWEAAAIERLEQSRATRSAEPQT